MSTEKASKTAIVKELAALAAAEFARELENRLIDVIALDIEAVPVPVAVPGEPGGPRLVPFWYVVPKTQDEVDRLGRALEEAQAWLWNNTAACTQHMCACRVPLGAGNCGKPE